MNCIVLPASLALAAIFLAEGVVFYLYGARSNRRQHNSAFHCPFLRGGVLITAIAKDRPSPFAPNAFAWPSRGQMAGVVVWSRSGKLTRTKTQPTSAWRPSQPSLTSRPPQSSLSSTPNCRPTARSNSPYFSHSQGGEGSAGVILRVTDPGLIVIEDSEALAAAHAAAAAAGASVHVRREPRDEVELAEAQSHRPPCRGSSVRYTSNSHSLHEQ
jgi:hypothetical protein